MGSIHRNVETARPAPCFDIPPYSVKMTQDWAYVANANGFNCLTFSDHPGAVLTSLEDAVEIARRWNAATSKDSK